MADEPWYSPTYKPPAPAPLQPGELLFTFPRGADRFRCELRKQGEFGIEAQFFQNDELYVGRRFDQREQAIEWATSERHAIEHGLARVAVGLAGCAGRIPELADHDPQCHGPAMACPTC
jgi:hypothetical protein